MRAPGFEAVAQLSPEEQRRLLDCGDAPERLWAAWAIALRLGRDALTLLRSLDDGDIPEGTRSQLLVILAGLGERDLLRTVATGDPSPSVRGTAVALYLRTAARPSDPDAVAFALTQLREGSPNVRTAVLIEQEFSRVAIPPLELLPTLRDGDATIRSLCAQCLARELPSDDQRTVAHALVEAFTAEPDSDARHHFLAALPRASVPDILVAAQQHSAGHFALAIGMVAKRFGPLEWQDVQAVAKTSDVEILRAILFHDLHPSPPDDLSWLCYAFRLVREDEAASARDVRRRSLQLILNSLTDDSVHSLSPADLQMLRTEFRTALEQLQAEIDEYGPDSGDEYAEELTRVLMSLG